MIEPAEFADERTAEQIKQDVIERLQLNRDEMREVSGLPPLDKSRTLPPVRNLVTPEVYAALMGGRNLDGKWHRGDPTTAILKLIELNNESCPKRIARKLRKLVGAILNTNNE